MSKISKLLWSGGLLLLGLAVSNAQSTNNNTITITLSDRPAHPIPKLYGVMFEDINHSGDGGLLAQLLRNPALQIKNPKTDQAGALEAWQAIGGIMLKAIDLSNNLPLSQALPNALEVTIPAGKTGAVLNSGYWGIKINQQWTYTATFYAKLAKNAVVKCGPKLAVQLISKDQPGTLFVEKNVISPCLDKTWQKFEVKIRPGQSATNANNAFAIKFTSTSQTNEVVHVTLVNLIPPTFKNRPNGVRRDLAEATASLKGSFWRYGGNNIEGFSPSNRWFWNHTIGPILQRPGRIGNWGYVNTDGFGLLEVLQYTEDLNMEFIGSVWSGLSLSPFKPVPESEIDKYIQEAIDMINFIIGPTSTAPGALRARLGHPEPFNMRWCEIGNEDFFSKESYAYRWQHLATALMKEFPKLKFIATTDPNDVKLSPIPHAYDIHSYSSPQYYVQHTHDYDKWPRNGPKIFQLEFAANTKLGQQPRFPTQEGAVAEAAYMTGFERNSDVVQGIAYAPTFCNTQVSEASQWHPNLINFDAMTVTKNPSYYVQQMFAQFLGDRYLPSNIPTKPGSVDWSATITSTGDTIFLKVVNIALPWKPAARVTIHTLENSVNSNNPPVNGKIPTRSSRKFSHVLPSQAVIAMVIPKA
ncbi:hypothetical protein CROQUDRAFT_36539 [Cronartium quercuum f. sp. fusiforme G11]|uniref:non-reducing end alpha-L-arabinofuranosidase n=1 Tax=Cronartium quercuum f. sp. fusiforme G11 TaxID=708437 RepID=A0A9P6NW92_9BASI|nr:hypothetical protein CROQUDRAFT_36539 [Cronartium quercuum f. sp. fusiforme G11]